MTEPGLKVRPGASLQAHNSLALPAVAEYLCTVTTREELAEAMAFAREKGLPVSILGGGSNTLLRRRVPGVVILVANRGLEVVEEDETAVSIAVAAGENWHRLVMTCLDRGWYGLENLALIPGSVGAAPIQNIGAYGVELSAFLQSVEVVDLATGENRVMDAHACELAYRDSIFKHGLKDRVLIWTVRLRLSRVPAVNLTYPELARAIGDTSPPPAEVAAAVIRLRQSKLPDPERVPNAGSFFKNPVLETEAAGRLVEACPDIPRFPLEDGRVKFPAAWLIDRAGWKGVRRGNVGVHPRQALVVVHYGKGDSEEILLFSKEIESDIKQKYNIDLEMEPVIMGSDG